MESLFSSFPFIKKAFDAINAERGEERWEEDEEYAVVFQDAVVVIGMDENRDLQVKAVLGEPIRIDEPCGFLAEGAQE